MRELRKKRKKGREKYDEKMDRVKRGGGEIEVGMKGEVFGEGGVMGWRVVG